MYQAKGAPPPPHLTSFHSALSDYAVAQSAVPDISPRGYEGKGKLYTVPETDSLTSPQANLATWDDNDADERVLKEIQKNLVKDKQRHQLASRDRKLTLVGVDKFDAENQGYTTTPKEARSSESLLEKWPRTNEVNYGQSTDKSQKCITINEDVNIPLQLRPPSRSGVTTSPLIVKDTSDKRCVFYFEEGNPHFVLVEENNVNAFLPPKIDEMEKIFRRVWREVFAVLRIVTSIFVLFIAELILFLAHHIVRPLVLDSITAIGDYVLKPLLALIFNAIIQPISAFMWNIFNALYQASEPLVKLLGNILAQVAIVLKAFKLFVIQWNSRSSGYRHDLEII